MSRTAMDQRRLSSVLLICLSLALAGCGFHLRGSSYTLPWQSFYVDLPENSELGAQLRQQIGAKKSVRIVDKAEQAEAIFQQISDSQSKDVLSFNTQGLVREYRLKRFYAMRVIDPKGTELIRPSRIFVSRDVSFNDSSVLAKDQEEALLWRDIQKDLLQQIMRRLSINHPSGIPSQAPAPTKGQ